MFVLLCRFKRHLNTYLKVVATLEATQAATSVVFTTAASANKTVIDFSLPVGIQLLKSFQLQGASPNSLP